MIMMLMRVSFTAYSTVLAPPAQLFLAPQHDDASTGNEGEDATGEDRTGQLVQREGGGYL